MIIIAHKGSGNQARSQSASLAGLLLLCLLWSSELLRADLLPHQMLTELPPYEKRALSYGLLVATAGLLGFVRGAKWPHNRLILGSALIGLGLFVVPVGLLSLARREISEYERVGLFTLVPVFAVVFEPYLGGKSGSQTPRGLAAALVSLAGALCVFPIKVPDSIESAIGFCAAILGAACLAATSCRAVAVASESAGKSDGAIVSMAAFAGLAASVVFVGASATLEKPVWEWVLFGPSLLWSVAVELPAFLLLFWLMTRLSAVQVTTRFVLTPLFTVLIGALAMQVTLRFQTWLGLLLMAAGSGYLLLVAQRTPDEQPLSLKQ